ncbi:MAG: phenylpyruvate tautomerase MIF-related protein [Methylobacter sp.]|uniref:phenylpyruvate tautomerase MIF-related protein n=1 Tax=Methylobacter sp. TaxID=2051955 RepID=UPI00258C1F64|nr:phenylpyruvate tautomerase MIF-related protein [Methylobacter sp.]MCL7422835.1 phenylpyruvate tautomerase MIF-related protein [Methylobacter sp.]
MPLLKLNINKTIPDQQAPQLLDQLSKLMAQQTGKPERYVMVQIEGGKAMLFAGSDQTLAYAECKSIGLTSAQAKAISSSLCQLLNDTLQIPADRVYIEFSNCPAEYWGWNGSTFG